MPWSPPFEQSPTPVAQARAGWQCPRPHPLPLLLQLVLALLLPLEHVCLDPVSGQQVVLAMVS